MIILKSVTFYTLLAPLRQFLWKTVNAIKTDVKICYVMQIYLKKNILQ